MTKIHNKKQESRINIMSRLDNGFWFATLKVLTPPATPFWFRRVSSL